MPTLSKSQLTETPSVWQEPGEEMRQKLYEIGETVLTALDFYREHDRPEDFGGKFREQVEAHKNAVLSEIAAALTLAASVAQSISVPVLIATLEKVRKAPDLIFSEDFPAAVLWYVAKAFQRAEEKPGTYWPDVMGEAPANFRKGLKTPTPENITAAASRAIGLVHGGRRRGRPRNFANEILADPLREIFLRYNSNITRHSLLCVKKNGRYYQIAGGPFFEFVEVVLGPLYAYLRNSHFPTVSSSGVIKHAMRAQLV
jgi:hypothetical protein